MNKEEFLNVLREDLKELPSEEIEKSAEYYSEMIDDRIEDGTEESEAVASLGSPEKIAEEILMNLPLKILVKSKMRPKNKNNHVLQIYASPGLAVAAVIILVLYAVGWVLIAALFAVAAAVVISGCFTIFSAVFMMVENFFGGLFLLGCGLASPGLGILLFIGMVKITKLYIKFSKFLVRKIKSFLIKKGAE